MHRATVLASVIMFALAGSGVDYYVNGATGSDSNNGTPDMGCYEHTDYSGFRVDIK